MSCGGSPAVPSPPIPPPPPPPPVVNTPPVINSITIPVTRSEVEQDVDVSADVSDAETPAESLIYQWSANAGTFSGEGRSVRWRLPRNSATTPVEVTVTLTVVERYQDPQIKVTSENRATKSGNSFWADDSDRELSDMTRRFLVDYFGHSEISPEACLVDFSDSCSGKRAELVDIQANRQNYVILSAQAAVASITYDAPRTHAKILAPCTFRSRDRSTGQVGTVTGDCSLTGVYENKRWWLCDSNFLNGRVIEGASTMLQKWLHGVGT